MRETVKERGRERERERERERGIGRETVVSIRLHSSVQKLYYYTISWVRYRNKMENSEDIRGQSENKNRQYLYYTWQEIHEICLMILSTKTRYHFFAKC